MGDMLEKKSTYETFLTSGETSLDFAMQPFEGLKAEIDQTTKRWDNLSTKLEKCLERLELIQVTICCIFWLNVFHSQLIL